MYVIRKNAISSHAYSHFLRVLCPFEEATITHRRRIERSLVVKNSLPYSIFHHSFPFGEKYFHSTSFYQSKEVSKVEETVKNLKEEVKKIKEHESQVLTKPVEKEIATPISPKRSLTKRVWDEIVHYYHGFRLLFIDIKVSSRLLYKITKGNPLSRREHRLLVRTVSDVFRLVPFSVFIIIPFMELLLPVFVKLFPGLLPTTFQTSFDKDTKIKQQLKVKIEMAKFLHDTLDEMALQSKGEAHSEKAKDFAEFFERIRTTGAQASNEEILKFSKLFQDEITLDNMPRPQLIALCRLLELTPMGTNNFLRFQLRNRIRTLQMDDQMIMDEGIDALTIQEIQAACRARGMRALGLPEQRLRSQLQQWLELSLNESIPPSLLLLSRVLYLPEKLAITDQLKVTLSSISDTAAIETKYKIGEMEGKVDNKTRLELIKKEEQLLKEEAEELKQQLIKEKKDDAKEEDIEKMAAALDSKQVAERLQVKVEVLKDTLAKRKEERKENEFTKEDFDEIENALETLSNEKKKLLVEKEELEDLKEDMAEYKQDIEELKDTVLETGHKEIRESKAALRLSNKVNKMISKMDKIIVDLDEEKSSVEQEIGEKIEMGTTLVKEKAGVISVNELVLALRRIQKVSDDSKMKRMADILEKMDVDHDGAVEVDHLLKVIELLSKENVKITIKQMDEIIDLLSKEDAFEIKEKLLKQKPITNEKYVAEEKTGQ